MTRQRKAQTAIEYLITYGWVVIIAVLVVGILWRMNLFSPSAGKTSAGFYEFSVGTDYKIESTGVATVVLTNRDRQARSVSLSSVTVDGKDTCSGDSGTLNPGQTWVITCTGVTAAQTGNAYAGVNIAVNYVVGGNLWRDPTTGTKSFTVTAADTIPPTISVTHSPASPSTIDQVTVTATASDNVAISSIQVYVDGSLVKTCTISPCATTPQTYSVGTHTYYATATDSSGNTARDPTTGTKSFTVTQFTYNLTVTKAGTGSGNVTSSPAGIDCGTTCSVAFNSATSVTLTATAASGSTFTSWSGACTGTATTCIVTMDSAKAVTATFTLVADTTPPVCSIGHNPLAPTVGQQVTLTATCTDNVGISSIQVYHDAALVNTCITSPCTYTTTCSSASTHTYYTIGTDTSGNTARDPVTGTNSYICTQPVGGWTPQPSGVLADLLGVHFVSSTTGWVSGNPDTVLKTTNSGSTWSILTPGTAGASLDAIKFVDTNNGWIVGSSGIIKKSTNGGSTWASQTSGTTNGLKDAFFFNSTHGWAVGLSGTVLKTINGGTTWTKLNLGLTGGIYGIHFISQNKGIFVGDTGLFGYTTDGGVSWSTSVVTPQAKLNDVYFVDANTVWIVGDGGNVYKSTNGGLSFTTVNIAGLVNSPNLYAVQFVGTSNGWIVGGGGTIVATTNGGTAWAPESSGTTSNLYDLYFVNTTTGWAVGQGGTILKRG